LKTNRGAFVEESMPSSGAVDVPFDRAIARALGDGAFDGAQVVAQFPDEALHGVHLGSALAIH
jgi:hypothetical protein